MRTVELFGRGTEEDFRIARLELLQQEALGRRKHKGEQQKSPRDLQYLHSIHALVGAEFKLLNLPQPEPVEPGRVHLFAQRSHFPLPNPATTPFFANPFDRSLHIDLNHYNRPETYVLDLLQGVLELHAHRTFHLHDTLVSAVPARVGYHNLDLRKVYSRDHFRGLQRAMTRALAEELYTQHWYSFASLYGFAHPREVFAEQTKSANEQPSLPELQRQWTRGLTQAISAHTLQPETAVWKELKRGYFTGNVLPLKSLERRYGPGTLRLLADIGSGLSEAQHRKEITDFLSVMNGVDQQEKERIALVRLSEQEWHAFARIVQATHRVPQETP